MRLGLLLIGLCGLAATAGGCVRVNYPDPDQFVRPYLRRDLSPEEEENARLRREIRREQEIRRELEEPPGPPRP
jgi:hypothetical protein